MSMAGIALYSNSPPAAAWSTQYSLSHSSSSHVDVDTHFRPGHHHSPALRPVVGGLSGLFSGKPSQSPGSGGDGLDGSLACSSGMVRSSSHENLSRIVRSSSHDNLSRIVRSSSHDNLSHSIGTWDCSDSRGGSASVPNGPSFPLKERSPVSVLHGPAPRNSHQNTSKHSLIGWDSVLGTPAGLPPLDPSLDRHSHKKSITIADERNPMSRSVGFEVASNSTPVKYQGRVRSAESSATCSTATSPEEETGNLYHHFLRNDNVLWPTAPTEAAALSMTNGEVSELQEARLQFSRLAADRAERSPLTSGTSKLQLSAEELLADAQERHKIFFNPVVIKAFWIAEEAHRGQVRLQLPPFSELLWCTGHGIRLPCFPFCLAVFASSFSKFLLRF